MDDVRSLVWPLECWHPTPGVTSNLCQRCRCCTARTASLHNSIVRNGGFTMECASRACIDRVMLWVRAKLGFTFTSPDALCYSACCLQPKFPTYPNPLSTQQTSSGLATPAAAAVVMGKGGLNRYHTRPRRVPTIHALKELKPEKHLDTALFGMRTSERS